MSEKKILITAAQSSLLETQRQRITYAESIFHAQIGMALAAAGVERGKVLRVETDPPAIVLEEPDNPEAT